MHTASVFLNCEIPNSSLLRSIGDLAHKPVRYFFHGRTVDVVYPPNKEMVMHHVASYHQDGADHRCRTNPELRSSSFNYLKTAVMVLGFVPGLLLGSAFKALDYYTSKTMQALHEKVIEHFNPKDFTVGHASASLEEIKGDLQALLRSPLHQKINALIIKGMPGLSIIHNVDELCKLNPKKLVLVGPKIVHTLSADFESLDNLLVNTGKWAKSPGRPHERAQDQTLILQKEVSNVGEALEDSPSVRPGILRKPHHCVYVVDARVAPPLAAAIPNEPAPSYAPPENLDSYPSMPACGHALAEPSAPEKNVI